MSNSPHSSHVEGFALGRLIEPISFELRSAGPKAGEYDPTPRYPDGTPITKGFATGTNRGRPKGTVLGIGHTAETKAQIVARYRAGEGLQVLAAAYSTTAQRVREIVIQAGLTIRPFGQQKKTDAQRSDDMALTKEQVQDLYTLADRGKPAAEIAETFGISVSGVYYQLKKRAATTPVQAESPEEPGLDVIVEASPKRQIPPKRDDVTEEMVRGWVVANKRDGVSPHSLAQGRDFSSGLVLGRIRSYISKHPNYREELGIATPPANEGQMDEPELALTAPEPPPTDDDVLAMARERTRDLHRKAQTVVAVRELPETPMFARKQYSPPQVTAFGELFKVGMVNAMPVAQMVGKLVEELNGIPGVKASFSFSYQMSVGA